MLSSADAQAVVSIAMVDATAFRQKVSASAEHLYERESLSPWELRRLRLLGYANTLGLAVYQVSQTSLAGATSWLFQNPDGRFSIIVDSQAVRRLREEHGAVGEACVLLSILHDIGHTRILSTIRSAEEFFSRTTQEDDERAWFYGVAFIGLLHADAMREATSRTPQEPVVPDWFLGSVGAFGDFVEAVQKRKPDITSLWEDVKRELPTDLDNESKDDLLIGNVYTIAALAGQMFVPRERRDWGIDGEIEFKDHRGYASGVRVYLQLKSGDSHLYKRKSDGAEIFTIRNKRHADYWQRQAYPVMLVIRTSDGIIRWMDMSAYLQGAAQEGKTTTQVVFKGDFFTSLSLRQMRDRMIPSPHGEYGD